MKVTLDVSAAIKGRAGLGRYAEHLAAALADQHPDSISQFANYTHDAKPIPALSTLPMHSTHMGYKPWRMAVWLAQMTRLPFNQLIGPTDVFHATEHLLMPLRGVPTVLTVHDLIFKLFPEHHKKLNYWYLNAAMPLYVKRADHIIAVSECTKRDLMAHYGTPEHKITVIYEAAAPHFQPQPPERIEAVRAKYNLPARYLMTVGTIEPRKNLACLVEALSILRADHPDLNLVVVGSLGWMTESFFEAIERFGQQDAVIRPGYVPDDDLPAMLGGAVAAVIPSLYEGFGLPVLEAMACGVPVACSSTSSVGEIAGEAALTFDPTDVGEMVLAIRTLVENESMLGELREKGLRRASEFSWVRAASETWGVYRQIASTSEIRAPAQPGRISLEQLKKDADVAQELIQSPNPATRRQAAKAFLDYLEEIASNCSEPRNRDSITPTHWLGWDERVKSLLLFAARDEDLMVRTNSIAALSYLWKCIGEPASSELDPVTELLISALPNVPSKYASEIAYNLGFIGEVRAIPAMLDILRRDHSSARLGVVEAIDEFGELAIPYLIEALDDPDPILQSHLVVILRDSFRTPEALAAVEAWRAKQNRE